MNDYSSLFLLATVIIYWYLFKKKFPILRKTLGLIPFANSWMENGKEFGIMGGGGAGISAQIFLFHNLFFRICCMVVQLGDCQLKEFEII